MKTTPFLSGGILAAALLLNPILAKADAAPRFSGVQPPPPAQNDATTTQAHLDALQSDLNRVLAALQKATNGNYGGHVQDAAKDVQKTMTDTTEASAYVKVHPEINPLALSPLPSETLPARPAVIPASNRVPGLNMIAAIDALNASLDDITNHSPNNAGGPVLGDIGGYRAKIVADIGLASVDVLACIAYTDQSQFSQRRGGPSPPAAPLQPTTQSHLEATQRSLNLALNALNSAVATRFGGHTEKAIAAVDHTLADVTEALAFVKAHPEIDPLKNGPAPAEISSARPAAIPAAGSGPRMVTALTDLNDALSSLLNNPARDYQGPIVGDIGGYRVKIMDGIGQAAREILAGLDYSSGDRGGFGPHPAPTAPPNGGNGFGPPPSAGASTGGGSMLPTAVAGVALSLALSLGGLHFLSQRRATK